MCREKADVNENVVKDWKEKLRSLMEGHSPSNIYNTNETGLLYDLQLNKMLCYRNEKCFGGGKSKMMITVLLAVNADGTDKLKPFVIGRAKAGFSGTQVESDEKVIFLFDPSEEVIWKEVTPGIDFSNYVTSDDGLSICATEVNEIVVLSEPVNSNSDAEIDNETPIKTYLMQQDVNEVVFSSLHKVKKELFRVRNQGNCQTLLSSTHFKISN
ncbi:hypothetical protein AVEN_146107-1 [Araneus ventricosus]|uniref:DDE-1 domain-containing protein n=1 Tax=Araneus ventricosus TaxID=182803 RepID=A0A4Y2IGS7_ARAVE|nr:hypothetical protein AVEN_146107-1 [Araneus ventricosus]